MVSFSLQGSVVTMKVIGFRKILALKSQIQFNKNNIKNIKIAEETLRPPMFKMPGTAIPWVITTGTYVYKGKKEFWDKVYKKKSLEIDLENEKYTKINVNVENPEEIINLLKPKNG
jgi:hypothetical protein